jgi:hypothetical protein
MGKCGRTILVAIGLTAFTPPLYAYPTSIIFAPTSESLGLAEFNLCTYVPADLRPSFGPSASWLGLDIGVLPKFPWSDALRFGGSEVGVDLIHGANHRDGSSYIKPIFNAKLSLLADSDSLPGLGFGLMSFAPFQPSESVNYTYLSATKGLRSLKHDWGALTLGIGYAVSASTFAFRGSPPLRDTRLAPLFGYSTPEWSGLTVSVDFVSGVSEMSSTNAAVSYSINEQTCLMLGAFFANDRAMPRDEIYDGVFVSLGATFEPFVHDADQAE